PGLLLFAVPVLLLAPVGEELTFRGLLQPALSGWMRPAAAIAITSVAFGALHWVYGLMALLVVFYGAVLGWAMVVTGRLRAPIVLHAMINALVFGMFVINELRTR
ncbi:MAG TPA: CPBP family intramembrane glutamic endopeptidase, partial [Myxococcaceae bacterium]|nr:CPBP family intramembrane glutamic endopeptidase [Myxococcaceae bacterium]